MTLHLAGIAATIASDAHAVCLFDQAGRHGVEALVVPRNIKLLSLPVKCPEHNRHENVWQFMRDDWLSNRIFRSYGDILDPCGFARNRLVDQSWRSISISTRK